MINQDIFFQTKDYIQMNDNHTNNPIKINDGCSAPVIKYKRMVLVIQWPKLISLGLNSASVSEWYLINTKWALKQMAHSKPNVYKMIIVITFLSVVIVLHVIVMPVPQLKWKGCHHDNLIVLGGI